MGGEGKEGFGTTALFEVHQIKKLAGMQRKGLVWSQDSMFLWAVLNHPYC